MHGKVSTITYSGEERASQNYETKNFPLKNGENLEGVGQSLLMPSVQNRLDPLQFAYPQGRSTTDAVVTVSHRITGHLAENSNNIACVLFLDFSSAFNCIKPHVMVNKLSNLGVPEPL